MSDRSRSPLARRSFANKLKTDNILLVAEVEHWKGLAEIWKNSADANWKGLVQLNEKTASQENTILDLKKQREELVNFQLKLEKEITVLKSRLESWREWAERFVHKCK